MRKKKAKILRDEIAEDVSLNEQLPDISRVLSVLLRKIETTDSPKPDGSHA